MGNWQEILQGMNPLYWSEKVGEAAVDVGSWPQNAQKMAGAIDPIRDPTYWHRQLNPPYEGVGLTNEIPKELYDYLIENGFPPVKAMLVVQGRIEEAGLTDKEFETVKLAAVEDMPTNVMSATNVEAEKRAAPEVAEDETVGGEPVYAEGFTGLPMRYDWQRTELSPWEQAQQAQWGVESEAAAQQRAAEEAWRQKQFERAGSQWQQEFGLKEDELLGRQKMAELDKKLQQMAEERNRWQVYLDDQARKRELGARLDTKEQWIQANLLKGGNVPQAPPWFEQYNVGGQGGKADVATSFQPLGAQAATAPDWQKKMLGSTARWQGEEGYGPSFAGVSGSPMNTYRR